MLKMTAETRMQPTPTMLRRENLDPTSRRLAPSRSRDRARTKAGIPPIQTEAPSRCSVVATIRMPRSSNRATECVVITAAARITPHRAINGTRAVLPENSSSASNSAAAILTKPATAKLAPMMFAKSIPTDCRTTATCIATVNACATISAIALHAVSSATRRDSPAPSNTCTAP